MQVMQLCTKDFGDFCHDNYELYMDSVDCLEVASYGKHCMSGSEGCFLWLPDSEQD